MTARKNQYRPGLSETLFRWLYSLLLALIVPFAFLNLIIRGQRRNKEYNHRRFERFGFVRPPAAPGGYLFHCVSVGEVVAASVLIKQLMKEEPETPVTITTTTPTGSARVRSIFKDSVHHFYLPYDLHMAMAGMLRRVKPKMVLITEVELWPNLIHSCWRRDIPVVVINARMTDRSARRYKKLKILFEPMLHKLSHVCAQGMRDFKNYQFLGIKQEKLTLTNNIKFDQAMAAPDAGASFYRLEKNARRVLIGGSTHEGEESALLDAYQSLKPGFPDLLLILVPRHPERFARVADLLEQTGLHYLRTASPGAQVSSETDVLLVDEMGKLNTAYTFGTIAFVGGSLADKGGHNALEPAAQKLPVLMGPNVYNNPLICQYLQECGALSIVEDATQLAACCKTLLDSPDAARVAGEAGFAVISANRGATGKTLEVIRSSL
ncbi:lipid IV(A) 3-deoxy-D-manno-octulosonic acid transferase [Alteromonas sp. 1_MG-2023]|uniref:lipid IV(A) 3-deoxy-D-manno-octulosonic acid transferase n=1 Tax=Alteromonas sp. 1_MG-2023 TaxID=3062669 RepID=UPI0026E31A2A|nr:lipid IV(A) 3-deoxy-D-manno-octulosonic acid transferase [Alteromonas sp. 1_MG-2023]MDO6473891.1 lipid IV(A) 3-deoxy-D-manno-octulosonic acid transferase [Alteromonas sp. 1_MG-2023]